jgi:hypothetical protein
VLIALAVGFRHASPTSALIVEFRPLLICFSSVSHSVPSLDNSFKISSIIIFIEIFSNISDSILSA